MQIKWSTFQRLTENNIREYVPTSAGVYLLWVQLESEKWRCYYVGQAQDLEDRLLAHISNNEINECIRDHVSKHINGCEYAKVTEQTDHDCKSYIVLIRNGPKMTAECLVDLVTSSSS